MAGPGFQLYRKKVTGAGMMEAHRTVASTQYKDGDACRLANGVLTKVTAAVKGAFIFNHIKTPKNLPQQATKDLSTAAQEEALAQRVEGDNCTIKTDLTGDAVPEINGIAAKSNATATEVVLDKAGSTGDYDGGTVYVPELGEKRIISTDTQSSGQKTFVVDQAFSRAVTVGDTVIAVPFKKGDTAVKFNATSPHQGIGVAPGDKTGGHNKIEDVVLENVPPFVLLSWPDLE